MCYGDQAANVPKKDVVPRKTRSLTIAKEIVIGELANSISIQESCTQRCQRSQLTIDGQIDALIIDTYAEWGQKRKELLPPKKCGRDRSSSSTSALPQEFEIGERSRNTCLERHEEQIKEIINHLDELSLDRIENMEDNIEGLEKVGMPPKRTLTSAALTMTQAAIRQLVVDSVTTALECSYKEFMSFQPFNFKGSEGGVGHIRWFERTESVFSCSNYTEDYKVKFATGTLTKEALSWWNSFAEPIGIEEAYKITWVKFKKLLIKKYCPQTEVQKMEDKFYHLTIKGNDLKTYVRRFQELATLCPTMVLDSEKIMKAFIGGLPRSIKRNVTASKPKTLKEAINISQRLMDQEKAVHIPIDGKTLIIRGAAHEARAPYRLAPLEMQELSDQLQELSSTESKDVPKTAFRTSAAEKNDAAKSSKDFVIDGVVKPATLLSAYQKLAKRNELKAREKRFEGNTKTKKVQKTILKQQFENFTGSSSEDLDQIHDRLQKLVSQLEIHTVSLSQEDVNLKFLRSLPSEWKTHTLIWRNKANLEEHSLDDLFNSLRIYEAKNDVDDREEMDLRWQMAMLTMRARRFLQKTGRNLGDNRLQLWVLICPKWSAITITERDILLGSVDLLRTQEGLIESYDWSYQSEEEPANFALMVITSSSSSSDNEIQLSGEYHDVPPPITGNFMPPKPDLVFHTASTDVETAHSAFTIQLYPAKPAQDISHATRPMAPIIEDWLSDSEDEFEPNDPQNATPKPTSSKTNGSSKRKNRKFCFVCRSVDHLIKDCHFYAKPKTQPILRNYAHRGYDKQYASFAKKYPQKHIVPAAVLTKSKTISVTAVRPVSADVPNVMVSRPRHVHSLNTRSNSTIRRHKTCSQSSKTSNSSPKVTAAKASMVSVVKGKKGKWVWRPKCSILDNDLRTTGASMTLKRFDYNDAPGRSKSVMAWVPKRI
nr:reverse transcriptase domain-containing protein [Tanacetum cinerariifolium]